MSDEYQIASPGCRASLVKDIEIMSCHGEDRSQLAAGSAVTYQGTSRKDNKHRIHVFIDRSSFYGYTDPDGLQIL